MNVPGYHLHFLSEDRRSGGHVLALELESGRLAIDDISNFHIERSTDGAFLVAELGGDRAAEVRKVEK
jgi:acetolactate decarboxylase